MKKNTNEYTRAMKNIYSIPLFLLSLLLITACSSEETGLDFPPVATTDKNVTLEVKIPGAKIPTSYGMTTAQENKINELTVLTYKMVGGFEVLQEKIVATSSDFSSDATGFVKVRLKIVAGTYNRIVLIANANSQVAGLVVNSNISVLNAIQYTHATGKWDVASPDYIPMYGELKAATNNSIEIKDGAWQIFSGIKLIRMLAKIDILNATSTFTLSEISLYNMNRNGLIAADLGKYSPTLPTLPTPNLPSPMQTAATITYTLPPLVTKFESEMYVFENVAPTKPTIGTSSPRIVIKGKYEGIDYYYPVDFTYDGAKPGTTKGDFMPIVRNHHYIFTIKKITGPGFATAQEARETSSIFTNVIETSLTTFSIDDDFTDVYYDADNYLAVSATNVTIGLENKSYLAAEFANTVPVLTSAPTFTITCYNNDGTLAPGNVLSPSSASYTGNNVKNNAYVRSAQLGIDFNGYIIVKAGMLSAKIQVTKKQI